MGIFSKILGGVPIVGDVFEGLWSGKEASKLRNWQRDMSDTSHQREVVDLRKAGLNPILSGTGGPGASTPSGAQAATPEFSRGMSSAVMLRQQLRNAQAEEEKLHTAASLDQALTQESKGRTDLNAQQIEGVSIENRFKANRATGELMKLQEEIQNLRTTRESTGVDIRRKSLELDALAKNSIALLENLGAPGQAVARQITEIMQGGGTSGDVGSRLEAITRLLGSFLFKGKK